jgi:hypothetical protein
MTADDLAELHGPAGRSGGVTGKKSDDAGEVPDAAVVELVEHVESSFGPRVDDDADDVAELAAAGPTPDPGPTTGTHTWDASGPTPGMTADAAAELDGPADRSEGVAGTETVKSDDAVEFTDGAIVEPVEHVESWSSSKRPPYMRLATSSSLSR